MRKLTTIAGFLDRELDASAFEDSAHNGLQVQNSGRVRRVCCGVDASLEFFRAAAARGADLLVCHHGISWGDSLRTITGLNYERIRFLMEHDIALYASHLPLDAHPRHGNNAGIARALGLRKLKPFGIYHGRTIGFLGMLPRATSLDGFKARVRKQINPHLQCMDFGPHTVRTVAIISGGAAGEIEQAARAGADVYLSGEPALSAHIVAQDYGINGVFAGHYATERFGVQALARLLNKRFGIPCDFVDLAVPF